MSLSGPRKYPLRMHPLPQINQVCYSLLHGIRRPGQRRPRGTPVPSPLRAGAQHPAGRRPAPCRPVPSTLQAVAVSVSPGCSSRARRSGPCAPSSAGIWDRHDIGDRRRQLLQPREDAGARGGAQARAVAPVPSERGAPSGRLCCKLWGAPPLSGAARSRRPAPDIAWEQGAQARRLGQRARSGAPSSALPSPPSPLPALIALLTLRLLGRGVAAPQSPSAPPVLCPFPPLHLL